MANDENRGCWDRFDRKTVLYFTGNKDTRVPSMEKELERVGLADAERLWQFPSPLYKTLLRHITHIPCLEHGGWFNSSMGHYRAIATAYHLGFEHALFMEDDMRFLKDLTEVDKIVRALPDDYDVALLDSFFKYWKEGTVNAEVMAKWRDERKVNEQWAEFDALYSLGCYALSRNGMKRMMFAFEAVETARSIGRMRIGDHFLSRDILGKGMRMYFARKNVAVQRDMGKANSPTSDIANKYVAMGLNFDDYSEP